MESVSERDAIISPTGLMSRHMYEYHDSEQQLYMPGSMGMASSIGLGIAVNKPDRRVIVIDGDASLLLNLGAMVTVSRYGTRNLTHILIDNRAYGSCSEEPSLSDIADFYEIAKIVGYNSVYKVDNEEDLKSAIKDSCDQGPAFILTKIELGGRRDLARPLEVESYKKRFMKFLEDG